ncbi:MAG TPA: hypothetical protein VGN17_29940 [Bryobacteraceae bacterium]|jgi:hypothetical protein
MRRACLTLFAILLMRDGLLRAEVLDRIAVTVDKRVITMSDILRDLRVSALLDGKSVDLSVAAKRAAATRLVDRTLLLQESASSHFDQPSGEDMACHVDPRVRYPTEVQFRAALVEYHLTEPELAASLLDGQRACEFTDLRFGPEVQISEQELRDSYNTFAAGWPRSHPGEPVPTFENSRSQVEELLMGQRVLEKLDAWLGMVRSERQIDYREAAFQ